MESTNRDKKISAIDHVGRVGLLITVFYVFIAQFANNIILQINGQRLSFLSFYWFLHIAGFIAGLIVVWRYDHPMMKVVGPIYTFCLGYYNVRMLIGEFWYTAPAVFVVHCILEALVLLNFFIFCKKVDQQVDRDQFISIVEKFKDTRLAWILVVLALPIIFLGQALYNIIQFIVAPNIKPTLKNRKFQIIAACSIIWLALTGISYFGFFQTIEIEDPGNNNDMSVSFWGLPFGGTNTTYYSSGDCDDELGFYAEWNATFYQTMSNFTLLNEERMDDYTVAFNKLEEFGIQFIIDITPHNSYGERGDFVTYYYTEEINNTIDLVVDYVKDEGFSNFRGISLDVEGPNYKVDNSGDPQVPDYEKWAAGVQSYQNKLNEFKTLCPGNKTFLISMSGILHDYFDDDADLDVMQKTCSVPPTWDYYGYMTYKLNSPNGPYDFYKALELGRRRHGEDFLPWIGWISDYDQLSDEPEVYESLIRQFKIVKSMGFNEVVIAPVRYMLGEYNDYGHRETIEQTMFDRLNDINSTRNSTFDPFSFQIHHDTRIYEDPALYWKKWTPYTYMASSSSWKDLMVETNGEWLMWVQIASAALVSVIYVIYHRRER